MMNVTCFFHLVQLWWRKALALGLRKKNYVETTRVLIFNLEILPFKEEEDAKYFYNKIKNHELFEDEKYEEFFKYFDGTWWKKYDFSLWCYSGKLPDVEKKLNQLKKEILMIIL